MQQDVIGTYVRRAAYRLLAIYGLVTLVVLICFGVTWRYWRNCVQGPQPMQAALIESLTDPHQVQDYWVTTSFPKVVESGWQTVSNLYGPANEVINSTVESGVYIAILHDHALLIDAPGKPDQAQFTGALVPYSAAMQDKIVPSLLAKAPQLNHRLLPFMLDCSNFYEDGLWGLAAAIPILAFAFFKLNQALRWLRFPDSHPDVAPLKRLGDPDRLCVLIGSEMQAEGQSLTQVGPATLTSHWLVAPHTYGVKIVRLDDVIWAYQRTTQKRGAQGGQLYDAVIFRRNGLATVIEGGPAFVKDLLAALSVRAPWMVIGYQQSQRDMWYQNREEFIATIDARCLALTSAPPVP